MQQYKKNLGKVSLTPEGSWKRYNGYEVLSIVYDENTNHAFVSKQDVPAGVDLYNNEYWMPLNVSGYVDSNIIILSDKIGEATIQSYTLEEAIKSIASVGRKPGAILGFYNENSDRLDIGGRWEIWQFNSTTISEWEDISHWQNIYYNYNKFVGWYNSENVLKKYNPFPEIGCYAFVGTELNEATIYRCNKKYVWEDTTQHAWDYVKVIIDGTVTVGENGNWFNNGIDTNIPASVKGENGKTPVFRNNNNIIEFSYDNESWKPISDEIAAWFRLENNKLQISRVNGVWETLSDYIAAWFRWESKGGQQTNSIGKIQITRDGVTWTDLSGEFVNNLRISRYIGVDESLPTEGIAEGTIYAKGPTYADGDTSHANPIYRLWVYAWKGNTLAWQDNGEFQSIVAGVVQETGDSETQVMSQKAVTEKLSELGSNLGAYQENQEYARAYTDAEGKFLWGIKKDGSIEFEKGVPTPIKKYIFDFVISRLDNVIIPEIETLKESHEQYLKESESPEWARVIVDAEGKVLWGIRKDGSVEFTKGVPSAVKSYIDSLDRNNDEEVERINQLVIGLLADVQPLKETYQYISNPEWACAIVDEKGRVLLGIKNDGRYYIPNREMFEKYEDVEGRTEMTLDSTGKILSYRDSNGVKNESKMIIKDSIKLGSAAMTELQKSLRESGFNVDNPIDWSNETVISLPIPRYCAKVNIISNTGLATTKTQDKKCILQYWDKSGNYFKKYIILNAQGSSSMNYKQKNQGIDVFNDENYEESCDITFGNWVAQDSFHLKCYYIDVFRGIANVGYNFCEEVINFMGSRNNRIKLDNSAITKENSTGSFDVDFGDGALCHPDGFPFEMYVNGEYYGLFAWNLKKHRKNYSMNKKDYTSALLDGVINSTTFFNDSIDWTQFELRNPKDLVTMDGRVYDADTNCNELIDETSEYYDSLNSVHVNTAKIKRIIERQSKAVPLIASESDIATARLLFESYYDVKAVICYFIVSNVIYNEDGFSKNWIWTIYNNIAAPSFYDLDSIFGRYWDGTKVVENSTTAILGTWGTSPTVQVKRLYSTEINSVYKELRDANVISVENIMKYVDDWVNRVGLIEYKKNIDKWTNIPSYRVEKTENDGSYSDGGMFDSPKRIELWLKERIAYLDNYFK